MEKNEPPIYDLSLFGGNLQSFWMDKLNELLLRFPILEFPHRQKFYMILILEKAQGQLWVDEYQIRLDHPKVVILRPYAIVKIDLHREAKGVIMAFTEDFFSIRYNNNVLYHFSFLQPQAVPYMRLSENQKERWIKFLGFFQEEYQRQAHETPNLLRSYLNILLFEIERLYRPQGFAKALTSKQQKFLEFINLVEKHYATKKHPSTYAEALHISSTYLNRICREETGLSAGEIIRNRIIMEAQRLLHYTQQPVKEIAYALGFKEVSYFVTFFKKQTGITPEKFRKKTL
ncbi:MAG: helix-turn-helix domain-containing protein [Bacteroidia bacterium]